MRGREGGKAFARHAFRVIKTGRGRRRRIKKEKERIVCMQITTRVRTSEMKSPNDVTNVNTERRYECKSRHLSRPMGKKPEDL